MPGNRGPETSRITQGYVNPTGTASQVFEPNDKRKTLTFVNGIVTNLFIGLSADDASAYTNPIRPGEAITLTKQMDGNLVTRGIFMLTEGPTVTVYYTEELIDF